MALFLLFSLLSSALSLSEVEAELEFSSFKQKFSKSYSKSEHEYRYQVFKNNLSYIQKINSENLGFLKNQVSRKPEIACWRTTYLMVFDSPDISLSNGENHSSLSSSYQKLFKLQWSLFYFETDNSSLLPFWRIE